VVLVLIVATVLAGDARAQGRDPWLGRDKALHFGASAGLALVGYGAGALVTDRTEARVALGVGVGFGAGLAKEMYDRRSGGDPSLRDLTWDAAGTAVGVVVAWLLDRYVFRRP
jgi:putative lipoprotein